MHKAKLGEENSFYFDPNAKKWVNKKAPASEQATRVAPAPPPPRAGPPSRVPSAMSAPDLGGAAPPMARKTPSFMGAPTPPVVEGVASEPGGFPSRNATPARSDVSGGGLEVPREVGSLHTLGGSASNPPSAPPSRPSTSMSNASSLDDLLAASGARKGGTIGKKGKKGGRYVDVMAK